MLSPPGPAPSLQPSSMGWYFPSFVNCWSLPSPTRFAFAPRRSPIHSTLPYLCQISGLVLYHTFRSMLSFFTLSPLILMLSLFLSPRHSVLPGNLAVSEARARVGGQAAERAADQAQETVRAEARARAMKKQQREQKDRYIPSIILLDLYRIQSSHNLSLQHPRPSTRKNPHNPKAHIKQP
jgi:hypothetical protein